MNVVAILCKSFGHSWRIGWAGARGGPFGAIVINYKRCERCGKEEYEYSTKLKMKGDSA